MINLDKAERKSIIIALQGKAKEVFELKKKHRQKRPIVIEFSGSPKSGKTTCINSLELFLKRNGFKVEIVQERASVCPVADKKSPMFNIWTACMSITRMIASLEQKVVNCDVLILDRGIFDAFCWFNWLSSKKAISNANKAVIENFLSMDLLVNRIDIVFAFTATPDVSIEREYANLLTDKPGTIMSKKTLSEYLSSVRYIIEDKRKYFHEVFEIDTSGKGPDEVGKSVTEMTLETLRVMLIENIGYIKPDMAVIKMLEEKRFISSIIDNSIADKLGGISFGMRNDIEACEELIQPIPIAVITDNKHKMVLTAKKKKKAVSDGSPEKDKILLYVGGHTRAEDVTNINANDLLSICRYTLQREVKEEIGISLTFDDIIPHLIYCPDSAKSKQHLALCFLVERDDIDELKLRIDEEELVRHREVNGTFFQNINKLVSEDSHNFEPWSIEIAKNLFDQNISAQLTLSSQQISLFDT
ncbi:MAG: hypothetical protein WCR95_00340 [Eubacteriales bacterium]